MLTTRLQLFDDYYITFEKESKSYPALYLSRYAYDSNKTLITESQVAQLKYLLEKYDELVKNHE